MLIRLLAIGNRMPAWVKQGYQEYAKRLPLHYRVELVEIPAEKRSKSLSAYSLIKMEGLKLLSAVKPGHLMVALNGPGQLWSTQKLSTHLQKWHDLGQNIDMLIGGADGLSQDCLQKALIHWSLSPLTFPHPLVRIIVVEQIYRAVSILQNHPYHRS